MKRIAITATVLVAAGALIVFATGASNGSSSNPTYKVELDNAFGLVNGEQFKVAGVPAGTISNVSLDRRTLRALVTVQVSQSGLGDFHKDAFCESRPQSLIGEYFLNCNPGTSGPTLKSGSTIPVTQTQSTIPGDLLQDIMRLPYRQRLTLIINELGAGVAGNAQNIQAALDRAVPALTQTDNLLNLLANDAHTLQDLTSTSNALVTQLANNSNSVQRFIVEANNAASDTATQQANLKQTFANLPGFLEQLRPALARLGQATAANEPALVNLNNSAGQIDRLLTDLPSFSTAAKPAIKSLGTASVTGKSAVIAANPTIRDLNRFAKPTPELGQNLSIVLHSLDDRSRAVEKDPRSPGGKGYTGLEALLQYVFQQVLDLNYLGPWGHLQAIDVFISPACSAYATPGTVANNLKAFGSSYRRCYSALGPTSPGVNSPDPSNPGACVPDPGGEPPYAPAGSHPVASACKTAAIARPAATRSSSAQHAKNTAAASSPATAAKPGSGAAGGGAGPPTNVGKAIGGLLGTIGGIGHSVSSVAGGSQSPTSTGSQGTSGSQAPSLGQAQQLLNYLLSP